MKKRKSNKSIMSSEKIKRRKLIKIQLTVESELVKENSIKVLKEFEKIEY